MKISIGRIVLALVIMGGVAGLLFVLAPQKPERPSNGLSGDLSDTIVFEDPWRQPRAGETGSRDMVVAGTQWSAAAARDILNQGGNAFDAAVAGLLALNVTYGEAASFPGVAPLLIHDAASGRTRSYIGAGTAPEAATIDLYKERGHDMVPLYDTLAQLVPASPDVIFSLLEDYGTMSFAQVSAEAIRLASEGFPVHTPMQRNLDLTIWERLGFRFLMPYNSKVYSQRGWWHPLTHGERFRRPDLAATWDEMVQEETRALAKGQSRGEALRAARAYFYEGPIAEKIDAFQKANDGTMTLADLARYKGGWEEPVAGRFGEHAVLSNGTWSQGIVVPMVLQILDGIDLAAMGHNSPAYIHAVSQAIDLTMADREAYVADPAFVPVPVDELLDPGFAAARRAAMTKTAFTAMTTPGVPSGGVPDYAKKIVAAAASGTWPLAQTFSPASQMGKDTSYIAIVDEAGNAVSLTPSDFPTSPMVPGTGLTLGVRMTQFRLNEDHPAALLPGKRPRITPHAVMLLKDGAFYMAIGTPGGDMQAQANVQVILNHLVFGMDIQEAINAPRFRTHAWPDAFAPHNYDPGLLVMEQSLYDQVADDMAAMGYHVKAKEDWHNSLSAVGAIVKLDNMLVGGSDPREGGIAKGR